MVPPPWLLLMQLGLLLLQWLRLLLRLLLLPLVALGASTYTTGPQHLNNSTSF
jgi:hypothetical protein